MHLSRRWFKAAVLSVLPALALVAYSQQPAAPAKVIPLDPADKTVLMGSDARLKGDLIEQWPGEAPHFWIMNWTSSNDSFTWTVRAPEAGDYSVSLLIVNCGQVLINCKLPSPAPVTVEVASDSGKLTYIVDKRNATATNEWARSEIPGTLRLPAGESKIVLRALAKPGEAFNLSLFSMELVKPDVAKTLAQRAAKLKSSAAWMQQAKYGLMFTWTAATYPRSGEKKSYADSVRDFNVNAFADMVAGTGAGFVVFATSWSEYYFPGPIDAIERIMPGRTTKRDLIGELADALNARGIKFMIYYHAGRAEKGWWTRDEMQKMDKKAYFNEWESAIREISLRYGDRLAGYWFDDGLTFYYPMRAPWEAMTKAAKAGSAERVVGYNSWILPKATDFQDFACGEGDFSDRITDDPELPLNGDGIFVAGPQKGLQATMTTTNEGNDWGHVAANTAIPAPKLSAPQMIAYIQKANARRNVPVINLEVYQDGSASPQALEEFKAINEAMKLAKH